MLLVALGVCSALPPYIGPTIGLELDVSSATEVVDHVLPSLVVIGFGGLAGWLARTGSEGSALDVFAVGMCFLAGAWSTLTHLPLWFDAGQSDTPWGSVILHGTLGPILTVLSGWLLLRATEGE
ncbi:MAG: hypothetical protein ACRDK5_10945 [Solirubrobacterales bacterium]